MMDSPEIQGACLYLPAVHPRLEDVLAGRSVPGLRVAVICLEDALAAGDIGSAMDVLRRLPKERAAQGPRVYVRPRNAEMLAELQAWGLDRRWCGYVLPKIDVRNAATASTSMTSLGNITWNSALNGFPQAIMPVASAVVLGRG